jgi:anti-sigma regulatory factor (Ser/Thr protein kinase)
VVASGRELGRAEFGADDLHRVRELVRSTSRERIPDRVEDAVLAVHEVAANTVVHGSGRGLLRVEETADSLVFMVEDDAPTEWVPVMRPMVAEATSGRGLWLARRLSDNLVIEARPTLTRVVVQLTLAPRP